MQDADTQACTTTGTSKTGSQVRQCPTHTGSDRPLIAHSIAVNLCLSRQRDFYHKCHRCQYRGKPVDFVAPDDTGAASASA